jgi:hypothetical protein
MTADDTPVSRGFAAAEFSCVEAVRTGVGGLGIETVMLERG